MLDNANPTVLSVSELPTRRQRRQRKEHIVPGGIEEMFFGKPNYELNPYYTLEYSDADSEDSNIEPIDEQEIYGKSASVCIFRFHGDACNEVALYREDYINTCLPIGYLLLSNWVGIELPFHALQGRSWGLVIGDPTTDVS